MYPFTDIKLVGSLKENSHRKCAIYIWEIN